MTQGDELLDEMGMNFIPSPVKIGMLLWIDRIIFRDEKMCFSSPFSSSLVTTFRMYMRPHPIPTLLSNLYWVNLWPALTHFVH